MLTADKIISPKDLTRVAFFLFVSIIFCLPILDNFKNWGGMDWDEVFFWHAFARDTILRYHQLPLWNPYAQPEGSLVFIAYPNSDFLSPFFIIVMLFGPIFGTKLLIIVHLFLGFWGMFLLARYLVLDEVPAYLSSFIYMLSSVFFLHLTEGHFEWVNMVFVPWFLLFFLKSLKKPIYVLAGALFLSLMLLGGSVDVFSILTVFLAIFVVTLTIKLRIILPIRNLLLILLITFSLCSIKLFPMFEYLTRFPRRVESPERTKVSLLSTVLLDRNQAKIYSETKWNGPDTKTARGKELGIDHGWHEYGAYIGIAPLLLFLLGSIFYLKKFWPWLAAGIVCLTLSLGNNHYLDLWSALRLIPFYAWLRVPSRFILGFIFIVAIFSGLGFQKIGQIIGNKRYVSLLVLGGLIFLDLFLVDTGIFRQAFQVLPIENIVRNYNFVQKSDFNDYIYQNGMRGGRYPAFLANEGVLKKVSYDIASPKGAVAAAGSPQYRKEAFLVNETGGARIKYFSPNKLIIEMQNKQEDILALNQNFYPGWKTRGGRDNTVFSYKGLIATKVLAGSQKVTLYFLPTSFIVGSIVSLGTVILSAYYLAIRNKKVAFS
jgi:hypothetical protein